MSVESDLAHADVCRIFMSIESALAHADACQRFELIQGITTTSEKAVVSLADEVLRLRRVEARYEYLRTLNVHQFAELFKKNIGGAGAFDDLVDEAIELRAATNKQNQFSPPS